MKKLLFLSFCIGCFLNIKASDIIPNGSFENWSSTTYSTPTNYPYSSNLQAYYEDELFNLEKTTEAYHGQYAIKLSTISTDFGPYMCYFINTDPGEGDISTWKNGFEYTQMPTGIRGYYKYNVETADSAMIMVVFRKNGNSIGNYVFRIGGQKNEYTLFDFQLSPSLSQIPDSVIFGAVSSDFIKNEGGVIGSVLYLDSVSFTGVSSQPDLMNGDFEQWSDFETPITLNDWNPQRKRMEGIQRTTDAKDGSYAVELTSFLGEEYGIPKTEPGYLATGYWDENCNCNRGGIPFTNTLDTLSFWYKYTPVSTDYAEVNMEFRKEGESINWIGTRLYASNNYQYAEIPFNIAQTPDSLNIFIVSSSWGNTDLSFIGSKLIVDKLMFKSEMTYSGLNDPTANNLINIYPTISSGIFPIQNPDQRSAYIEVYNSKGVKVKTYSGIINAIDLDKSAPGVYYVRIISNHNPFTIKLIKL